MFLFADYHGLPVPMLPDDAQGNRRLADNRNLFTLTQAAIRFGRHEDVLREFALKFYDDVLREPEQPATRTGKTFVFSVELAA